MKGQNKVLSCCSILGVQLLRPSRFSFSCHLATDIGSHSASAPRMASISGENSRGSTGDAETTLATCTPFFRNIGDSDMFMTTTDTLLLLILSLVYACRTCNPGGRGHTPQGWDSPALKVTWALSPVSSLTLHSSPVSSLTLHLSESDLSLKQSQPNILLHEDWLVHFLTCWIFRGGGPLLCRTIPSHAWVFYYSAPPAQ